MSISLEKVALARRVSSESVRVRFDRRRSSESVLGCLARHISSESVQVIAFNVRRTGAPDYCRSEDYACKRSR